MKPHYTSNSIVEFLPNGRDIKVVKSLSFWCGSAWWIVPENAIVNGASIPRIMWFFIGSPFVGKYRRASMVHDVYCERKQRSHKAVHLMFYRAMLCDGVPKYKAKIMYNAVKYFGPKWKTKKMINKQELNCTKCSAYFKAPDNNMIGVEIGQCRRFPPVPVLIPTGAGQANLSAMFPPVGLDNPICCAFVPSSKKPGADLTN